MTRAKKIFTIYCCKPDYLKLVTSMPHLIYNEGCLYFIYKTQISVEVMFNCFYHRWWDNNCWNNQVLFHIYTITFLANISRKISSLNDGACAVLLSTEEKAKELGIKPLAKIISYADAETNPIDFPVAPAMVINKLLTAANLKSGDISLFEVNEALAVVPLAGNLRSGQRIKEQYQHHLFYICIPYMYHGEKWE